MTVPDHNSEPKPDALRRLIGERLKARLLKETVPDSEAHPDDDSVNAFVEGRLDEEQSAALVSHFVHCGACLHLTAQLVRYRSATDEVGDATMPEPETGPLRRFLDHLASGLTPASTEDTVFAYQEKDEAAAVNDETESDSSEPG
jgi:hypothetical protein